MKEIYKDIKGYEGLYQVSNLGRIKSLRSKKILCCGINSGGYCTICFSINSLSKSFRVHRLVAEAFIPNPENKPQINHINGDKTDNRVENLEWVTQSENMQHAFKNGLNKRKIGKENKKSIKVNQYSKKGEYIKTWCCIKDVERTLKIQDYNISSCCKGKRKTAGGFMWRYVNE